MTDRLLTAVPVLDVAGERPTELGAPFAGVLESAQDGVSFVGRESSAAVEGLQ